MISKLTPVCATRDSRHAPSDASSSRAGTITDIVGCAVAGSGAGIRQIRYYNFVRRSSLLIGFLTVLLAGCYSGSRPPHIGNPAPDFTVQDADRKVSLGDLRGQVVVLNFWATWCAPCVEEMPSLVQMQQKMKNKGVDVLAGYVVVVDCATQAWSPGSGGGAWRAGPRGFLRGCGNAR